MTLRLRIEVLLLPLPEPEDPIDDALRRMVGHAIDTVRVVSPPNVDQEQKERCSSELVETALSPTTLTSAALAGRDSVSQEIPLIPPFRVGFPIASFRSMHPEYRISVSRQCTHHRALSSLAGSGLRLGDELPAHSENLHEVYHD